MTLTQLGETAIDADAAQIILTSNEARDIVTQAEDAEERCHLLGARIEELEKALGQRDETIAGLRADAEHTRTGLARALGLTGAGA